jgi:E3 ubiquitin-protein ligase HUWE1
MVPSLMLILCLASFNQLDLPEYGSYDALRKNLLLAIKEGSEGFGFA